MDTPLSELKKLFPEKVFTDAVALNAHSGDLWPRRLLLQRQHHTEMLPSAVVKPTNIVEIQQLVQWANQVLMALVPMGGRSGVCGATAIMCPSVAVDLSGMNRVLEIDTVSHLVKAEAGILGSDLEKKLNEKGLTLGHFPASFHISTIGGWISTRASGQCSTAYGSIEDMVLSLKVVLGNGEIMETHLSPRSSIGPSLQELFLGGEGMFGIVTEATCQVRKQATERIFISYRFSDIHTALTSIRTVLHEGIFPSVVRLYDEPDTQLLLSQMNMESHGNLLVVILEGNREIMKAEASLCHKLFSAVGENLGELPGKHWYDHRFDLNDKKMTMMLSQEGVILDTVEVAAPWNRLEALYQGIKRAFPADVLVMAHFSHFYETGGSIYFTFVGSVDEKKVISIYDDIWESVMKATLAAGGTISHHHGIGLARKPWIREVLGSGWKVLSDIKKILDPNQILNPDKWL